MTVATRALVARLSLILLSILVSPSLGDVASGFDANAEGWEAWEGSSESTVTWVPVGGSPGGYIQTTDSNPNAVRYFKAPDFFGGDQTRAHRMQFSLRQAISSPSQLFAEDVFLHAPGVTLSFTLSGNPTQDPTWRPYAVPLNNVAGTAAGAWRYAGTTQASTLGVLRQTMKTLQFETQHFGPGFPTNPTNPRGPIHVRAEFNGSATGDVIVDTNHLDSFQLEGGRPFGAIPLRGNVNIDITPKSIGPSVIPPAAGFRVRLSGPMAINSLSDMFPGYSSPSINPPRGRGFFNGRATASETTPQITTLLKWDDFDDDDNNLIDPGQIFHPGFNTNGPRTLQEMFFVDATGQRIANSAVYNVLNDTMWDQSNNSVAVIYENVAEDPGGATDPLTVSNVQFAILNQEIALADLNVTNTALISAMQPVPGGTSFVIDFGEINELAIPQALLPGQALVMLYNVSSPNSAADTLNFVQSVAVPEPGSLTILTLVYLVSRRRR